MDGGSSSGTTAGRSNQKSSEPEPAFLTVL